MSDQVFYLVRLESIRKSKKNADRRIADYILTHLPELSSFTLQTIAEKTETSYITVCRFFKNLGLTGIKEFKNILLNEIKKNGTKNLFQPDFAVEEENPVSLEELEEKICEYSAGVVSNCHKIIHTEQLERAADIMKSAIHIHFIGLGTSAVAAHYAYIKFSRLKPSCTYDTDIILSKMRTAQLGGNCVLFAISSSGRTKSILEISGVARKNGVTVISVCDYLGSPLTNLSDVCLCTTVRESSKYIDVDFPLIQGQITIIDILYAYLYHKTSAVSSLSFQKTKHVIADDKVK